MDSSPVGTMGLFFFNLFMAKKKERYDVYYSLREGIEETVIFFAAEAAGGEMKNYECEVSALEWLLYEKAKKN